MVIYPQKINLGRTTLSKTALTLLIRVKGRVHLLDEFVIKKIYTEHVLHFWWVLLLASYTKECTLSAT